MKPNLPLIIASAATLAACGLHNPTGGYSPGAITPSLGLPAVNTAAAQRLLSPDETLQTLDFPASGTQTLSGRIEGYKSAAYALPIRKGQRLDVTMATPSTSAYFNIVDARDASGVALFAGETAGTNTAMLRATEDATYVLRPYLMRAVARRGSSADYTFRIERQ
jgi:hypothetical protein